MILTAEMFGDKWPFKVQGIIVTTMSGAFIIETKEVPYALNGIAENRGYEPLDDHLWRNDLKNGCKMSLSPILDYIQKRG